MGGKYCNEKIKMDGGLSREERGKMAIFQMGLGWSFECVEMQRISVKADSIFLFPPFPIRENVIIPSIITHQLVCRRMLVHR